MTVIDRVAEDLRVDRSELVRAIALTPFAIVFVVALLAVVVLLAAVLGEPMP